VKRLAWLALAAAVALVIFDWRGLREATRAAQAERDYWRR
jgi:hypothetical protein